MSGIVDPSLAERLEQALRAMPPVDYGATPPLEVARILRSRSPRPTLAAAADLAISDHDIAVKGGSIAVRSYRPLNGFHGGAVLNLHGGGWVLGDIDGDDERCRMLARASGCQVLSVDYRRAPEHPFPTAAEDCYAALQWVVSRADDLGIDADRIGVIGSSAGGNLAAAVALMSRDRGGPKIAFQLLVYPACDPAMNSGSYAEHGHRFPLTREDMVWFWDQYAPGVSAVHPYAAVCRAETLEGLPPAHLALAECDVLRDEGLAYADRLAAAGVQVTTTVYEGMVHGFLALALDHPVSQNAIADFARRLHANLGCREQPSA